MRDHYFFFSAQRVIVRKNIISELRRGTHKGGVIRFFNAHVEVTSKDSNPKDVAISHGCDALSPTHRGLEKRVGNIKCLKEVQEIWMEERE